MIQIYTCFLHHSMSGSPFISFILYICIAVWIPLTGLTPPHRCACPQLGRARVSNVICLGIFMFSELRWEVIVCFWWYWWNSLHFLFIRKKTNNIIIIWVLIGLHNWRNRIQTFVAAYLLFYTFIYHFHGLWWEFGKKWISDLINYVLMVRIIGI